MFGGGEPFGEEEDGTFTFGGHELDYADLPPPKEEEEEVYNSEELKANVNKELEESFKLFDINGDGLIDLNELSSIMKSVGKEVDIDEIQEILEEIDLDGDGSLCFDEFKEVMYDKMMTGTLDEDLQEVFDVFDEDKDGFISASEVQKMFEKLGTLISLDEAQEIMGECDENNDGLIDFEEFKWFYGKIDPLYFKKFQPQQPQLEDADISKLASAVAAFQTGQGEIETDQTFLQVAIPSL